MQQILKGYSMYSSKSRQRGMTLIESLVALVVAAIALFGLVGIQMRTLVDTQMGVRRAQAVRLIEDLGERLQNNPNAFAQLSTYASTPGSSPACGTGPCSPADLATYDIARWRESVANNLPGGQAQVFIPKGGSRQLGVLIGWREGDYNIEGKARTASETAALSTPFTVSATDSADTAITCPTGMICHLQYLQPTQRCTPWAIGGGTLYCAN